MTASSEPVLSVVALYAEREQQRRLDQVGEELLRKKTQEELSTFKRRLDEFQVTDTHVQSLIHRVRATFERGESELMLTSFPSSFCTDGGRAVNNADQPPINEPSEEEKAMQPGEPTWLGTLPRGARPIYQYWEKNLKPSGFALSARIISYPGGVPGDVGLFLSWPKSAMEAAVAE